MANHVTSSAFKVNPHLLSEQARGPVEQVTLFSVADLGNEHMRRLAAIIDGVQLDAALHAEERWTQPERADVVTQRTNLLYNAARNRVAFIEGVKHR